MKLCYIVDFRSPHARNWITHFVREGHEVHIVSTFPAEPTDPPMASLTVIPLDFSARIRSTSVGAGSKDGVKAVKSSHGNPAISKLRGSPLWVALAGLRDRVSPLAVKIQKGKVRRLIDSLQPDLVHSMRIPFEGVLTTAAIAHRPDLPYVQSIWGNDFTLFAEGSQLIGKLTRAVVARADALHPDCHKDMEEGWKWGFDRAKPWTVLPGGGGVHTRQFCPGAKDVELAKRFDIPPGAPIVINPRGVKPYIRTECFFEAIPIVLKQRPNTIFLGGMMQGNGIAQNCVDRLGIAASVRLLPYVDHMQMAGLFRLADITVSPSDHDGTPNTLIEGMACGAFPVAGNIASVREWITDGENGILVDQKSPASIADGILRALDDDALRSRAAEINPGMIQRLVSYESVMQRAEEFYKTVIAYKSQSTKAVPARDDELIPATQSD
jgi:glycosyltransferase involved in cell wall biosynthesis